MEVHYKTADVDTIVSLCEKNEIPKKMRMIATEKVCEINPSPKIVDGSTEMTYTEENVFVFVWSDNSVKVFATKKEILPGYFWNGSQIVLNAVFELNACEIGGKLVSEAQQDAKPENTQSQNAQPQEPPLPTPEQELSNNTKNALEQSIIEEEIKALIDELHVLQEPKLYTESELQAHKDKFAQVIATMQEELRILKEKMESYSTKDEVVVPQTPRKTSISLTPSLSEKLINDLATFDRKKLKHVEDVLESEKKKGKQEQEPVLNERKRPKHGEKKRRRWTNNRIYEDTLNQNL